MPEVQEAPRKSRAKKDSAALEEAILKQPLRSDANGEPAAKEKVEVAESRYSEPTIAVSVDWQNLPMRLAEPLYQQLKREFEKAGSILNARHSAEQDGYTCKICRNRRTGRPGMTDLSWRNPDTGLFERVDLCSEFCVVRWNEYRINERRDREIAAREAAEG